MATHPPRRIAAPALAGLLAACAAVPSAVPPGGVLDARSERVTTFERMVEELATVRVVYVGESHDNPEHHEIQRRIVEALSDRNPRLIVGMEMLQQPYQPVLDRWSAGELEEADFLREVSWYDQWSDWDLYGPILRLCRDRRIRVVGLHLPGLGPGGLISREIARNGLENIPSWMRLQLPAEIDTTDEAHRKAIRKAMSGHAGAPGRPGMEFDEARFARSYQAQCAWDETFAENTAKALAEGPPGCAIVVIAGSMHVKDFRAAPERTRRRNGLDYRVVLPVERAPGEEAEEIPLGMGRPADYVLFTAPSPPGGPGRLGARLRGGDSMVASVASPSAAEGAGLQPGDVLLDLDGFVVRDAVDLRLAEESMVPGSTVHVRWRRGEAVMEGAGTVAAPRPFGPPPGPRPKPEEKK